MRTILVPLDNRPVTYVFPQLIARIAGIEALMPPRTLMGSLSGDTNIEALTEWLSNTLTGSSPDSLLVCLDSIIYGGLIPSRRTTLTTAQLLERTKQITRWKKQARSLSKVFAQASIMRVSDNYDNTEEKPYWSQYGREIFSWSEALHRMSAAGLSAADDQRKAQAAKLQQIETRIEAAVREDYLSSRRRNFQVNNKLLDYVESGNIDLLIYSQDDSGQFGLNVLEKDRLITAARTRKLTNVRAYAGADEVLMTMLSRRLVQKAGRAPLVKVSFSPTDGGMIASRYEGQSLSDSVHNQLSAAGLQEETRSPQPPELHIIVHTAGDRQGDHICLSGMPDMSHINTTSSVSTTIELIETSTSPVVLCDLAYANGADPTLIQQLLTKPHLLAKLWGYAGWNTSGNSLGCAISTGIARWFAGENNNTARADAVLKTALFIRLADDWAYQANARQELSNTNLALERLNQLMAPYLKQIAAGLDYHPQVKLSLPWQRSFEVEVHVSEPMHVAG